MAEFQLEPTEDEDTVSDDPETVDKEDEPSGSSGDGITSVSPAKVAEDFEELEDVEPEADEWVEAPVDCKQSVYTDLIRE